MNLQSAQQYCLDKTRKSHSSFYAGFIFLPADKKHALNALYAFCREVDDVVDECQEPTVAHAKISWWQQEIERMYQGSPSHPVTIALQPWCKSIPLPQRYFQEILEGMMMDINHQGFEDFEALSKYCYCVASTVGVLTAKILGYSQPSTQDYAIQLGLSLQLINIIRDLGEDIRRGRCYLPQQDCERFGVTEHDLYQKHPSAGLIECLTLQAQRAREAYQQALQSLAAVDRKAQKPGLVMANIYHDLLKVIEAEKFDVLRHKIALTLRSKLWITTKTLLFSNHA